MDPVKNFAKCTVSQGYDDIATSIVLVAGDGAKLPDPSTEGAFNLVWWNSTDYPDPADDPNKEIVRCTARTTDTLTITRAQEGTTATVKNLSGKTYKMVLSFTKKGYDDIETGKANDPHGNEAHSVNYAADANVLKKDGSVSITANWNIDGLDTLFIDRTNKRVGIGTVSPGVALTFSHNSSGIGFEYSDMSSSVFHTITKPTAGSPLTFKTTYSTWPSTAQLFEFQGGEGNVVMEMLNSGNVGIGTTGPQSKLDVSGGVAIGSYAGVNAAPTNGLIVSGLVGIGTSNPIGNLSGSAIPLDIVSSGQHSVVRIKSGATGQKVTGVWLNSFDWGDAGAGWYMGTENSGNMKIGYGSNFPTAKDGTTGLFINTSGNVGIGTTAPTAKLDVSSDILRLRTAKTPASAGAAGNAGDICWDANYVYVCVATNTWKRVALNTW